MNRSNLLLLTYDSCRHDVLQEAATPALDSFADILPAQSPATFTYAAHHAFFAGILPNVSRDLPYYNRFTAQLLGLQEVGETTVVKDAWHRVSSSWNLVAGLRDQGYLTIGAGAMNWFRQASLTRGFTAFRYTGTDADTQIDFLLNSIEENRPFFGFINFGETHNPYSFAGKTDRCPVNVRARSMRWPPVEVGPVGRASPAYDHQRRAAEFLDSRLPRLLSGLPEDTLVILCADHGECFGEDGYWGHGINHPKVFEVPLALFRLDGREIGAPKD